MGGDRTRRKRQAGAISLFLSGLLDSLRAAVQGALALGLLLHVLLGLGLCSRY